MTPNRFLVRIAAGLCLVVAGVPLRAEVRPDPFFADAMVIQRDAPLVVRGTGDPNEIVSVRFGDSVATVRVDGTGRWSARLPARPAHAVGTTLTIEGPGNTVTLRDVLVGDVWVSAGQSNMEWPVSKDEEAQAALASAGDDGLRLLTYARPRFDGAVAPVDPDAHERLDPERFYSGTWARDGKASASGASAVAYWFGRKLRAETGVPIGLVGFAVGGAPLESFFPADALATLYPSKMRGDWLKNPELPAWCSARAAQDLAKVPDAPADERGRNHGCKPGFAWEAGMGRIAGLPVRGFLWYQGESNAIEPARVKEYPSLQAAMVAEWRARWGDPTLPFYFVQLSSCEGDIRRHWGEFRDGQRLGAALIPRPSGMVVSHDCGPAPDAMSDVHPPEKRRVGERLARLALRDVYGKTGTVVSGPSPARVSVRGSTLVVSLDSAVGLKTSSGGPIRGFEVAGADGAFVRAEARIVGETAEVFAASVAAPRAARYAWASWCRESNLVNGDDLPAPTFLLTVP